MRFGCGRFPSCSFAFLSDFHSTDFLSTDSLDEQTDSKLAVLIRSLYELNLWKDLIKRKEDALRIFFSKVFSSRFLNSNW